MCAADHELLLIHFTTYNTALCLNLCIIRRRRKEAEIVGTWIPSSQAPRGPPSRPGSTGPVRGDRITLQDSTHYETFLEDALPYSHRSTNPTPPINIEPDNAVDHYSVPADSLQEYSNRVREYEVPATSTSTPFVGSGRSPPPSYSSIDEPPLPPQSPRPSHYLDPVSSHREYTDSSIKTNSPSQHGGPGGSHVYFKLSNTVIGQPSKETPSTESQTIKSQNDQPVYFALEAATAKDKVTDSHNMAPGSSITEL